MMLKRKEEEEKPNLRKQLEESYEYARKSF